jgi:signal transduction histidine kinase
LKYTEKGTVIVSVHTDAESRPVRIDVTDTGEGIPNERLKAVFEVFNRGTHDNDRAIEGVGLGLSIARTLCTMLGYTLEVKSEEGKGSTFSVHLVPLPTPL